MSRSDIKELSYQEISDYLQTQKEQPYRAQQIFDWIYKKGVWSFDEMTTLSQGLRERLKKDFILKPNTVADHRISRDGTAKFLFELHDHQKIESVLIPTEKRVTACVSTQAGCKFGCTFCASGINGWVRNLTCAEILNQVLFIKDQAAQRHQRLSHIVFMGTGEPLDNLSNVFKAIHIINSPEGVNIAARHITISTVGIIPKFKDLADQNIQFELAVSLHGYDDASRNALMPVNKKYPIRELMAACRTYIQKTNRQVTFEYVLIDGLTCSDLAGRKLGKLLKGMMCKLNLVVYNQVQEFGYNPPGKEDIQALTQRLEQEGIHFTLRRTRGQDILAACGQLRHQGDKHRD